MEPEKESKRKRASLAPLEGGQGGDDDNDLNSRFF
jgi:hypothetical protein